MRTNILTLAVAGTLLMATGLAGAAPSPATTTLSVSAKVASNCLVTAASLIFSDYDASAPVDGQADLSVNCSNLTPYTIQLGAGANGGTIAQRLLASGSNRLEYNLYTTGARTMIWGEASGSTVAGIGRGMSTNKVNKHTVYGTIANTEANQDAPTGSYADTVAVTVVY